MGFLWAICLCLFLKLESVQFSCSIVSDCLQPHESQHARPPCPSPTPGVHSYSCPLSRWCHPAISSSVVPFSSCSQSLLASESFPMSQLFAWGGQSIGVSALASVLPKNTQDWSPSEWTGWISLQSKGLSRVFSKLRKQSKNIPNAVGLDMGMRVEMTLNASKIFNLNNWLQWCHLVKLGRLRKSVLGDLVLVILIQLTY